MNDTSPNPYQPGEAAALPMDAAAGGGGPIAVRLGTRTLTEAEALASIRGGANWFFWIAALSAVNVVLIASGSETTMIMGLGVTIAFQAAAKGLIEQGVHGAGLVAYIIDVAILGLFALLGWKARQERSWAFIAGMALYLLDSMVFLAAQLWLAVGFHAFVLFMLWGSYGLLRRLQAARRAAA
jgi:hypothetical protein